MKGISNPRVIIQRNAQYESGKEIYLSLYLDLLIYNNFSSMTFFCAKRILRVIGRESIQQPRFNSVARFSPTKLSQTEFLTNKGINFYVFTEGALDFSPTKRNKLLILEISH